MPAPELSGEMEKSLRPVVFFDRDGTLNLDRGYTFRPDDLCWLDGAIEAIRLVNSRDWLAVVVSNQSGVARGYYDEAAVLRFHTHMNEELAKAGARIDAFYYCPFHAEASIEAYRRPDHPDRKPNPGMLTRAFADLPADPKRALIVGDQESDLAAGVAAGIISVRATGESLLQVIERAIAELDWA